MTCGPAGGEADEFDAESELLLEHPTNVATRTVKPTKPTMIPRFTMRSLFPSSASLIGVALRSLGGAGDDEISTASSRTTHIAQPWYPTDRTLKHWFTCGNTVNPCVSTEPVSGPGSGRCRSHRGLCGHPSLAVAIAMNASPRGLGPDLDSAVM